VHTDACGLRHLCMSLAWTAAGYRGALPIWEHHWTSPVKQLYQQLCFILKPLYSHLLPGEANRLSSVTCGSTMSARGLLTRRWQQGSHFVAPLTKTGMVAGAVLQI